MVKWLKTALIVVFVSLAAFAQDNVPQWELYGGYQYTRISTGFVQDQLNLQHQLNPTVPLFNFGRHQNLNGWKWARERQPLVWWRSGCERKLRDEQHKSWDCARKHSHRNTTHKDPRIHDDGRSTIYLASHG